MCASRSLRLLRGFLAAALACSWLLLAGLPAGALITGSSVESPRKPGAVLRKATPLVIAVNRTTATDDGKIKVLTRLFYGGTPAPPQNPEPSESPEPGEGDAGEGDAGTQQEATQQQQEPGALKPVSKKLLPLPFLEAKEGSSPTTEVIRFGGPNAPIDPYNLAWLPEGGTAPNGQYTLEYLVDSNATDGEEDRQRYEFRLDAPPPPQGAPGVGVQDPAAKRMIVAWQRNFAPDISSYTVERRRDSGEWRVAQDKIKPDQSQITDKVGAYGEYQYRVVAIRPAGDGSKEMRATTSAPSKRLALQPPSQAVPGGGDDGTGSGTGTGTGDGTTTDPGTSSSGSSGTGSVPSLSGAPSTASGFGTQTDDTTQAPGVAMPRGFDDTFQGPLDYNVQQDEVTERVPVEVAQGGTTEDGGTLEMLNRSVDQQRVLPPLAGGLILVLSAAHVLRYLNE